MGLCGLTQFIWGLFPSRVNVADRSRLKPFVRPTAEREAIYAFRRKAMLLSGLVGGRKGRNSRATNAGSAFRAPYPKMNPHGRAAVGQVFSVHENS